MMNQVVLVGRLTSDPEINEVKNNGTEKKQVLITLAVYRSFKNADGIYETDFIPCVLWDGIASNTCEYCKKGDIVGVKGRLQVINDKLFVIADRVTFLSSKQVNEDE